MKKTITLIVLLAFLGLNQKVKAQFEDGYFNRISAALNVSTTGPGLELATPLGQNFALRAGINLLPITVDYTYNKKLLNIEVDADLKLMNGNLLADYYPFKKAGFHITAGFYVGNIGVEASGYNYSSIDIPKEYISQRAFIVGDYLVQPNMEDGKVDLKVKTNAFKPYVGIGFGRAIPKSRFGFKVDLGAMYSGDITIESNGVGTLVSKTNGNESITIEGTEYKIPKVDASVLDWKFYPVLNLQLVYRIY